MPLNGSGTYNLPNPPVFPAVAGTTIKASDFNAIMNDIAAAITAMIARDGQSTITGVLQWAQPGANLAALGGVALTGAQTIAGVKTFSSAPKSSAAASAADDLMRKGEVDAALSSAIPSGAVMPFARNTAPSGWLKCDGALVSRTTYAALFAAIGTTYGAGDGSTTFALPDLRGEFVRGWDDGRGVDSGRAFGSSQTHSLQDFRLSNAGRNSPGDTTTNFYKAQVDVGYNANAVGSATDAVILRTAGTSGFGGLVPVNANVSTETRPRNVALLYCIKT